MRSRNSIILISGLAVAACSTIVNGTTQSITVLTPPIEGASCELTNSEGSWFLTSPGEATVDKTKNELTITCRKEGFHDASLTIESSFVGDTVGNILFGAGILIAAPIDAFTGANYLYPSVAAITMAPLTEPAPPLAH